MGNRFLPLLEQTIKTLYISPQLAKDKFSLDLVIDRAVEEEGYLDFEREKDLKELAKQVNEFCFKLIHSYPGHAVSSLKAKTIVAGTFYMVQAARGKHYSIRHCRYLIEGVLDETVKETAIVKFFTNALNYEPVKKALREINKSCGSPKVSIDVSPKLIEVFNEP